MSHINDSKQLLGEDNSGLNGYQLRCLGNNDTDKFLGQNGVWLPWKQCSDGNYVVGVDVRGKWSGPPGTDLFGVTDLRMK